MFISNSLRKCQHFRKPAHILPQTHTILNQEGGFWRLYFSMLNVHWNHLENLRNKVASDLPPESELIDLGSVLGIKGLTKHTGDSNMPNRVESLNLKLIQTKVKHLGFLISLSYVNFYLGNKLLKIDITKFTATKIKYT